MLTASEQNYILTHAYIPEHLVGLMTSVSGADPYLIQDCLCCHRDDWVIVVGYPLQNEFRLDVLENVLSAIKKKFKPRFLSLVAPSLPQSLHRACKEKDSDFYYTLDLPIMGMKNNVKRNIKKAQQFLWIERSSRMEAAHQDLIREFMNRIHPPIRVKELLSKMPEYLDQENQAMVLNAWDEKERLSAFYVIDLAAKNFANYIIGSYSQNNYVRGASDLLLFELIQISAEHNKQYIHIGLGINDGIRRFKVKWGGRPAYRYEMCELVLRKPSLFETIMTTVKSRSR